MVKNSEETREKEVLLPSDALVCELKSLTECFGMKKPPHPERDASQIRDGAVLSTLQDSIKLS
jgi:hypothetical protein